LWKNIVGTTLLYGSFLIHIPLGFYSIAKKKSYKITGREWFQIILPVLALLVLLQHVAGGFIATRVFNADFSYGALFSALLLDPNEATLSTIFFTLLVIFIWTHGVIGINSLLRYHMKSYFDYRRWLFATYYAVPVVAIFGFWAGLKEQSFLAYAKSLQGEENYLFSVLLQTIPEEAFPILGQVEPLVMSYYPMVVLALIVISIASVVRAKYFGRIKISYPDGKEISVPKGTSILEASRLAGIPHQSSDLDSGKSNYLVFRD
jgi:adenylate cyclase